VPQSCKAFGLQPLAASAYAFVIKRQRDGDSMLLLLLFIAVRMDQEMFGIILGDAICVKDLLW